MLFVFHFLAPYQVSHIPHPNVYHRKIQLVSIYQNIMHLLQHVPMEMHRNYDYRITHRRVCVLQFHFLYHKTGKLRDNYAIYAKLICTTYSALLNTTDREREGEGEIRRNRDIETEKLKSQTEKSNEITQIWHKTTYITLCDIDFS